MEIMNTEYELLLDKAERIKSKHNEKLSRELIEDLSNVISNFEMGLIYPEELFKQVRDVEKTLRPTLIK